MPQQGSFRDNAPMPSLIPPPCRRATGRTRVVRRAALASAVAVALAGASLAQAAEHRSLRTAATEAASHVWTSAQDIAVYALSLIGVKYKFGGNTPASGLDCSGLVRYVFQEVTGVTLPRTSREMSGVGTKVKRDDLVPGDLVFFNTRRFPNSHVGIYLGDGRFIHAPSRGGDVEIATLDATYWRKRFDGARRLVEALPSLAPDFVASAHAAPLPPSAATGETSTEAGAAGSPARFTLDPAAATP